MQYPDGHWCKVLTLERDEEITPFVEAVQEAECSQPIQAAGQLQVGGMPGLQGDGQAQHEEGQPIDEVNDLTVDGEQVADEVEHTNDNRLEG